MPGAKMDDARELRMLVPELGKNLLDEPKESYERNNR
jgi:hypothetical protein